MPNEPTYKPLARIKDNTNNVVFLIKATGLENSKTITLTSDVTGSATFDLTDNILHDFERRGHARQARYRLGAERQDLERNDRA